MERATDLSGNVWLAVWLSGRTLADDDGVSEKREIKRVRADGNRSRRGAEVSQSAAAAGETARTNKFTGAKEKIRERERKSVRASDADSQQ